MVTALFTIVVIALTVVAFWRPRLLMNLVAVIAWLVWSFLMYNQTYPDGNTYLRTAVTIFGLSMVFVMIVMWLREYFSGRFKKLTSSEIQTEHKRKVMALTKPRRKTNGWDE